MQRKEEEDRRRSLNSFTSCEGEEEEEEEDRRSLNSFTSYEGAEEEDRQAGPHIISYCMSKESCPILCNELLSNLSAWSKPTILKDQQNWCIVMPTRTVFTLFSFKRQENICRKHYQLGSVHDFLMGRIMTHMQKFVYKCMFDRRRRRRTTASNAASIWTRGIWRIK